MTENNLRTDVENHVNNNSSLDTGGANDNKMEDCPTSSMDHNMDNTWSNINTMVGEHCVVNSAHGNPIEKSDILHDSSHSPLHASSCSKERQEDSQQQDSCTQDNLAFSCRSGSSLGAELITSQDTDGLINGTNLLSVDLVPGDNLKDSAQHKFVEDEKPSPCSPSATKDAALLHSNQVTCTQLAPSGASNDDKPSTIEDNVQYTCNEVSQTGVRDKGVKVNGMVDLPMSTTRTFKRKRRQNSRANNPVSSEVTNMNRELQSKSNGDIVYSPISRNEINKSDGDDHLPLVKRARVRMERPTPEDTTADEHDHSYEKTEPTKHEDPCYKHATPVISGNDQSADDIPPSVDASPKINLPVPSGVVPDYCNNNKEYQPKVLTLDVEAALPPSKRLHRALEAMSANTSDTLSNLLEATRSNDVTLKGCTASTERSPPNNSADALVKSPKSALAESPKVSLSPHSLDAPTGQKHITQAVLLNKDAFSPVRLDLRNDDVSDSIQRDRVSEEACMDSENIPNLVRTGTDNDDTGKTPTCSMKLEEPAFVSKFDQSPSQKARGNEPTESIEGSKNAFSITINVSPELISQANAVVSYTNGTCDPVDDTVLAEPTANICDGTSTTSLVSKVSCIHSDTSTRTFEE